MTDDVILNKVATIERCVQRIREEYDGHENDFVTNYTKQDAIILNLQRACEAAIDIATRVVRLQHLGLPQSSREVIVLLEQAKIIAPELSNSLQSMVGFRNIAMHNYTSLNLDIVKAILTTKLNDFLLYSKQILLTIQ